MKMIQQKKIFHQYGFELSVESAPSASCDLQYVEQNMAVISSVLDLCTREDAQKKKEFLSSNGAWKRKMHVFAECVYKEKKLSVFLPSDIRKKIFLHVVESCMRSQFYENGCVPYLVYVMDSLTHDLDETEKPIVNRYTQLALVCDDKQKRKQYTEMSKTHEMVDRTRNLNHIGNDLIGIYRELLSLVVRMSKMDRILRTYLNLDLQEQIDALYVRFLVYTEDSRFSEQFRGVRELRGTCGDMLTLDNEENWNMMWNTI